MSAAPTVTLKQDWDYQPRLGDPRGHHASRHAEQAAVADFVERRDEGSMLVVGRRGSGKTSMVIAAVNGAVDRRPQGKTILPVLIRATSIESDGAIDKKQLLVSLIRSLKREVPGNRGASGMRKQVDELYENATATAKSKINSTSKAATWSLHLAMIPPYALALLLLLFGDQWLEEYQWAAAIAMLIPALSLAGRWGASKRLAVSSRHDYTFADMQHEFERLLQDHASTHKAVFILDEFDKAGGTQAVPSIMAPLKMLINQGGALYVFITSPDRVGGIESRPAVDYTVFSDTLYVKRSLFEEMEAFIDEIVDARSTGLTDAQYDDFRSYLCYMARADFFDLHRVIRDQRTGVDDRGRPVLNAALNTREQTAANLQRAIKYVYERKAFGHLSEQENNDKMLEIMYELSTKSENMINKTISINDLNIDAGGKPKRYTTHEASAALDLFTLLSNEGYAENNNGVFTIKGKLSAFKGGTHVAEERSFVAAYAKLVDAMVNIANCKIIMDGHAGRFDSNAAEENWDDLCGVVAAAAPVSIPDEMRRCMLQIGEPGKPSVPPDELRQYTGQARNALSKIRTRSVNMVARAFELRLGMTTAAHNELPPDLVSAEGVGDRALYCAVAGKPGAGNEIRLAIVDAQKTTASESLRSSMSITRDAANEVVVLLVGDNIPDSLRQSFFVADSTDTDGQITTEARIRADDCVMYGIVLASPPTPRDLWLVIMAVEKIKKERLSGQMFDFELDWQELKSVVAGRDVSEKWFGSRPDNEGTGA